MPTIPYKTESTRQDKMTKSWKKNAPRKKMHGLSPLLPEISLISHPPKSLKKSPTPSLNQFHPGDNTITTTTTDITLEKRQKVRKREQNISVI